MAYLPVQQVSLLTLIAERLRRITMRDWLAIGISLAGIGIVTWSAVQKLEYRVGKIENTLEQHLEKHEGQNKEILKALQSLELEVTRLSK